MRALSLFGIFVLAKALILAGHEVPLSVCTPFAYLWQDAFVALLVGAVDVAASKRPWIGWSIYGVILIYVAVNVPLARVLSSPLTWQMSRAAGGALADSIRHHLTPGNFGCIFLILLAGTVLPLALRNLSRRVKLAASYTAMVLVALGPVATARVETVGLHRNALAALVMSTFPRVGTELASQDWRAPYFDKGTGEDLSRYRGIAAGRNVIMIHLESTGARYLKPYGTAEDPMPNLTKWVEASLLFENTYAVYPESIKGLFSVLCSRYPAFDTPPEIYAHVSTPSIAQELAASGYHTALFHSGRFMYLGMNAVIQNRGYEVLEDAGAIGGNFNSSFGVDEPATVKRMLTWMDSLPWGERFFLTYLPIAGHHPYETPEHGPYPESEELDSYRNALHYSDTALGELMKGLMSRGLDTNTLFIIFGDHGEAFGQHEGNYGHTLFIYEENVRVPCVVFAPGLIQEQLRVSRVASLIDLAPTLLDLLGLRIPTSYQGKSRLRDQGGPALFFTDYSLGFTGLRDGDWKFIHELESGRSKLFNLPEDPAEKRNLAADFPERVAAYHEHLRRWSAAQKQLIAQAK